MVNSTKISDLAAYVNSLKNFVFFDFAEGNFNHMGATIVDAILQAGLNYNTVVRPRTDEIKKYPEAKTTTGFSNLFKREGLNKLINWTDREKLGRIENITEFFIKEKIESEENLKKWLFADENILKLKAQRGIGDKTVDYFKILAGISTSAIDRHLLNFLREAGIEAEDYQDAKRIIDCAADHLGVERNKFDYSVWKYMSEKSNRKKCGKDGNI